MRLETTFSDEFDELYNDFNRNDNGRKLLDIDGISRQCIDVGEMSHRYFTENLSDVTIDSNANVDDGISPNNYGAEIVKGIQKIEGYYLLHRYAVKRFGLERANELIRAIWSGDIYFHDASGVGVQQPYCWAASTDMIMLEGRPYGHLHSLPPKRSDSFTSQVIEYVMDMSQSFCGAVAISDFIVNYSWYAKRENLMDDTIINDMQRLTHVVNNSFRVGGQAPFCNLSIFDFSNLKKLFEHHVYPDGLTPDFEYIMKVQRLFVEWFAKGDPSSGMPYRFPVVTMNISCDENKKILDEEFLEWVSKVNTPTGCFNIYINDGDKISSCCRLTNNLKRMQFRADTFGNGGISLGSHRVVTINLPRIALRSNGDHAKFADELDRCLYMCRDLHQVHREEILKRRIDQGFLKFYSPLKWFSLDHMFSTIGIIGVYEACESMDLNIYSDDGIKFVKDMLVEIEIAADKFSQETGHSFNVEEIPGESVASKLCAKDKIVFGDENVPCNMYSNQYIPLVADATIPERIEITGKFQEILSGGGILHLNIMDQIKDTTIMKKLIVYAVSKGVAHLAINYGFGTCGNGHTTICGNSEKCSMCGGKIEEHVTRVIGYFAKVSNWGKVRRDWEFPRRRFQ